MSLTKATPDAGHVLCGTQVRVLAEPVPVGLPAPSDSKAGSGPHIRLIRDGDTIRSIEVTCTCGEKVRLDCIY